MNALATLVRREFWEHRGLWIAPLVVAIVLVVGSVFSGVHGGHIQINGQELNALAAMNDERRAEVFGLFIGGMMIPHMIVMLVVLFFYLSDALYGERKDRSILFWKSLPVSDANTVVSKLVTALIAAPLIAFAASAVTGLLCYLIIKAKLSGSAFDGFSAWNSAMWLRMTGIILMDLFIASLWYAPLGTYVLLVSGWAKRTVILWVVLPPLVVVITERWFLSSSYFAHFLGYRIAGLFSRMGTQFDDGAPMKGAVIHDRMAHLGGALEKLNLSPLLMNPDLWLGLLAAAVMVLITIRLRRYRDDTSG